MKSIINENTRATSIVVAVVAAFVLGYVAHGHSAQGSAAGTPPLPNAQATKVSAEAARTAPIIGTVTSITSNTLAVKTDINGAQRDVALDSSTKISAMKIVSESWSDIHLGDTVAVLSTIKQDGSIVAATIQIAASSLQATSSAVSAKPL